MNRPPTPSERADRDAFFTQLLAEIKAAESGLFLVQSKKAAPKDSGDPADGLPDASPVAASGLAGALNANLTPSMLPFEDFVRGVCHKQHPFCD